jgi:hypothetical protein
MVSRQVLFGVFQMNAKALNEISPPQISELRVGLFPLLEVCPVAGSNPEDCPFHLVRKMDPAQRLQWFHALGEDGLGYLAAYHHVCLNSKLALKAVTTY